MYSHEFLIHFVGIGGVGMAGIAEVLLNLGYRVSGSDTKRSNLTDHLAEIGAQISIGHREENLPVGTSVVVVSSAVPLENPELVVAHERSIPVIPRAEMLAELMRMKYGIAIAGSHGKTTTTTMTAKVLSDAKLDPTVIIGGRVLKERSGARLGTGQYLVAEADESDGSFSFLRPAIAVVTNIDSEHLNHYGSFGKLEEAFLAFLSSVPFYGLIVACGDDPVIRRLLARVSRRVVTYGLSPENDIFASDIVSERGSSRFQLGLKNGASWEVSLPMPGTHMISNALAAVGVGRELGVSIEDCAKSLAAFPGVARRSEVVGEPNGIVVIDDYGHHPTEIKRTLEGIRASYVPSGSRLVVLFQPHRYSRTKDLFADFCSAFASSDEVVVGEIYSAGEKALDGVSGESLAKSIQIERCSFVRDLRESIPGLVKTLRTGDVVVTLGAGSIGNLGPEIVSSIQSIERKSHA
ncbi:MAG: UDP-N-acetylmuramate--L-alanine ligase [Deltaproteobacteria bacterium]|nr:UDP-N-acetylmuramate--L-alanine ligase [Deltaproteobacteria bacterium]